MASRDDENNGRNIDNKHQEALRYRMSIYRDTVRILRPWVLNYIITINM